MAEKLDDDRIEKRVDPSQMIVINHAEGKFITTFDDIKAIDVNNDKDYRAKISEVRQEERPTQEFKYPSAWESFHDEKCKKFRKLPPEEKATKHKSYISLMWSLFNRDGQPDKQLQTRLVKFYKENPHRIYPDPEVITNTDKKPNYGESRILHVVAKVLANDREYAHRLDLDKRQSH